MTTSAIRTSGLGKSDHVCINFRLKCSSTPNIRKEPTFNFSKGDYGRVRHLLNEIDWEALLGNLSTDQAWKLFCTELNKIIQVCIPKSIVKSKRKHPYINAKVFKLKYQKDRLWKKYSNSGDSLDYLRYTQKRNEIRNLTRSLRLNYESNIASNLRNNPKRFWTYVKSKTKVRYSIPTLKSLDNNEAITDNEKAAMLNSFFSSVFTKEDLNNFRHINNHQYTIQLIYYH